MRLDELVELMLDVVCSKRAAIRISGEEMPAEVVKSRFLKLGAEHIQYVLDCIKDNPPRILDPFAGAGTTVLAAVQEGYEAVGIEMSDAYFQRSTERLKTALESEVNQN